MEHGKKSLRTQMILTVVFCWVLPILIVAASGAYLLYRSYAQSMRQELELAGSYAVGQTAARVENVLFESKMVSYDGEVRNAYRLYQIDGDSAALYRKTSAYLKQRFLRRESVAAMFLSFWNEPELKPYMTNQGDDSSRLVLARYTEFEPELLADMANVDTAVRIYTRDGLMYAARNLLDSKMKPYATVVVLCDLNYLSAPIASLNLVGPAFGSLDGILISPDGKLITDSGLSVPEGQYPFTFSESVEGHTVALSAQLRAFDFSMGIKGIPMAVALVTALILILLVSIVRFFSTQISRPVNTLVEATGRVRKGERGYRITQSAGSREFETLFSHFNSMSEELKNQFEYAREEQQNLHQAKIKALQSQINPHFLNNTLEIINWEARIAKNEQITNMIEALSTMLNASLNREDNPLVTLREELHYTDAYLYIIGVRMGHRLEISRDVDETLLDVPVPRMILQPLVENAVEHDLSRTGGGRLLIGIGRQDGYIRLSVEHSGHILPEGKAKLERLLSPELSEPEDRMHIGIRNVNQRLHLIYGDAFRLTIREVTDGLIRAEIGLPEKS